MIFTYRHLSVDNLEAISDELKTFAHPHVEGKTRTDLWALDMNQFLSSCPNTVEYFKSINQLDNLYKCCIVVVQPNILESAKAPHVDNNIEPPIESGISKGCISLNFNIQNGEVETCPAVFYNYISGEKTIRPLGDPNEGSYIFYIGCEMEEISRYTLTTPVIMNNSVPHLINNRMDTPRISMSFRFKQDPWDFAKNG